MNINIKKCQVFSLPEQLLFFSMSTEYATVLNYLVTHYFHGNFSSAYAQTDIQEVQALIFC